MRHGFDQAVFGQCVNGKRRGHVLDGLVVDGVRAERFGSEDARGGRAFDGHDFMNGIERVLDAPMLLVVERELVDVLTQRSPAYHVDHLKAAAYPQEGKVVLDAITNDHRLDAITRDDGVVACGSALAAV